MENRKEQKLLKRAAAAAIAWMLLISATLTTSTYAWFSSNARVKTDSITVYTKKYNDLTMEISRKGGNEFVPEENLVPVQVNKYNMMELMPVSTADLKTFVTCINGDGRDVDSQYGVVQNEEYFYHGQFYIRIRSDYTEPNIERRVFAVKLERNPFEAVATAEQKLSMVSAVRLGITIDDEETVILADGQKDSFSITWLNGEEVKPGYVLGVQDGEITAVPVNTVFLEDDKYGDGYLVNLLETELNVIHKVDLYVYIEGCDPDCTNSISLTEMNFSLDLYGEEIERGGKG